MTEHEQENFELQLRQTKPARPPEDFAARLLAAEPGPKTGIESAPCVPPIPDFLRTLRQSLRWLIPATAVVLAVTVVWHGSRPFASRTAISAAGPQTSPGATPPVLKADDVKIAQRLMSSFDAVARLPGGEPVRFRCENWMDQVVLSDKSRGLVVENRKPRIEVVAMGYETY
jgi:hypothetical protein